MITVFGIKNCDTVKKARRWLDEAHINYRFHDVRADGITQQQVQSWVDTLGWETLVNKRSTTWKSLDEAARQAMNKETAIQAILDNPTLIKRPLLDTGSTQRVGFNADEYRLLLNQ